MTLHAQPKAVGYVYCSLYLVYRAHFSVVSSAAPFFSAGSLPPSRNLQASSRELYSTHTQSRQSFEQHSSGSGSCGRSCCLVKLFRCKSSAALAASAVEGAAGAVAVDFSEENVRTRWVCPGSGSWRRRTAEERGEMRRGITQASKERATAIRRGNSSSTSLHYVVWK